jgi:uncharacterized RDD family membrane protein YckC
VATVRETASWARRLVALFLDGLACVGVTILVLGPTGWSENSWSSAYTLVIFVLENALFTALLGGSFGQMLTGLRVVRLNGQRLDAARALLRAVLIALVIPPLVFQPDGRGLHDLAVGSMVIRLGEASEVPQ